MDLVSEFRERTLSFVLARLQCPPLFFFSPACFFATLHVTDVVAGACAACVWRPSCLCVTSILYIAIHSHCASLLLDCQCCSNKGRRNSFVPETAFPGLGFWVAAPFFGTMK